MFMDVTAVLETLLHGNQLKRTPRTGWVQRGVPQAENVAAHSFGVVYVTLILAPLVEEEIDLGKALAMAALHDLPEGLTSDIPTPAWVYLPPDIKTSVERQAMLTMLADVAFAAPLLAWWEELHTAVSPEAHLVHDADKLEMFIQAVMYEEQTGNRQLAEFWHIPHTFHYPQAQALYEELRRRRQAQS
ncbi:MAG: HD domain-containing protein [Ardenticatenaceae bacterium]|nr:HD domain-containing protein [Ardenticatenaceae bacterium]